MNLFSSSMYNVPATADMMKQTAVPFALIISPFAKTLEGEIIPPIVNFGEVGPIRCIRCKGYMSPNMQFIDAGRRFQCLLCKATTEGNYALSILIRDLNILIRDLFLYSQFHKSISNI